MRQPSITFIQYLYLALDARSIKNKMRHTVTILTLLLVLFISCKQSEAQSEQAQSTGSWSHMDSVSYAIGKDYAKKLLDQKIDIDVDAFGAGLRANSGEEEPLLSGTTAQMLLIELQQEIQNRNKPVRIGEVAPDLAMATPTGEMMKLSDLQGKIVLVDFWASWCKPCRMENPNVVRVYNKYKDKGFEIIGVSLDKDKAAWEQAIEADGLTWKHMSDLQFWGSEAVKAYGIQGIPYTVLLDKEGKILAENLRGPRLESTLANLFAEK